MMFINRAVSKPRRSAAVRLQRFVSLPILVLVVGPQRKIGLLDGPSQRPSKLIYVRAVSPIVSNREAPLLGRIESTTTAKINHAAPGRLGQRQYRRSDADAHAIQTHQNLQPLRRFL